MTGPEFFTSLLFLATILVLMAGFPVAFSLAGTALGVAAIAAFFGAFDLPLLAAIPSRIFGNAMWNETLLAVPLFIFMGLMLEKSKVAEGLLEAAGRLFGRLGGGLGIAVFLVGALLAASTGIVGASVVTMGLMSLPTMLKHGYDPKLAAGSICASGTLGQIIPPSIVLIILGEQISNAYVTAEGIRGNWSPEPVSVGDLFAGALLPGLLLVGLYILYQIAIAILKPSAAPALKPELQTPGSPSALRALLSALVPPVILIVAVLGSILMGIATATEAASVGAVGALLLGGKMRGGVTTFLVYAAGVSLFAILLLNHFYDFRIGAEGMNASGRRGLIFLVPLLLLTLAGMGASLWHLQKSGLLREVCKGTLEMTAMVFTILIGATIFSLVFRGLGGDSLVQEILTGLPGGTLGALIAVMAVIFVLGFFLDFVEISFVVVPIVAPVLLLMGINPVWLGVMIALNLQTSFLTPPFGFALFYLRGAAPKDITTGMIYKGVIPFVLIQLLALLLLALFPELATWLPSAIFGSNFKT